MGPQYEKQSGILSDAFTSMPLDYFFNGFSLFLTKSASGILLRMSKSFTFSYTLSVPVRSHYVSVR